MLQGYKSSFERMQVPGKLIAETIRLAEEERSKPKIHVTPKNSKVLRWALPLAAAAVFAVFTVSSNYFTNRSLIITPLTDSYLVETVELSNGSLIFEDKSKDLIPNDSLFGSSKNLNKAVISIEEYTENFGKGMRFKSFPKNFKLVASDAAMYTNKDDVVVFDELSQRYQSGDGSKNLKISMTKNGWISNDYPNLTYNSVIGDKQLYTGLLNIGWYSEFKKDDFTYFILAEGVSQEEFILILSDLLK